jgi:uncharacterized caspase-like protein
MKRLIPSLLCLALVNLVHAQRSSAVSNAVFISINPTQPAPKKEVKQEKIKPPFLEITDFNFVDSNGNMKIDAEEVSHIQFKLKNTGLGKGNNLVVKLNELNNISGLVFEKTTSIGNLDTGKIITVNIPIQGNMDIKNATANFSLKVDEANGFGTDELPVEVMTQAFKSPQVKIVDYSVSSQNSTTIVKRKPFDLQALVQNIGQGTASEVVVNLVLPKNVFCISTNEKEVLGELKPGEKKIITYNLVANNEYSADKLPFEFRIDERYGKFGEPGAYTLAMNQTVSGEKLRVQGIDDRNEVKINIASLGSDVDKNIPSIGKKYSNRIALIIGNEDYAQSVNAQINVPYAVRDAQVFKEYAINTLGIAENNIFHFTNATAGVMKREIDRISKLATKLGNSTEVVFYYAGHGFPDEKSKIPYLIPVDVSSSNLMDAVSLKSLYTTLGATGASKITVFLDACFSGGGRDQGMLAARGIRIVPDQQQCIGNMVVFSASKGDQVALPYHEQQHGLFTYFMLKKLQESKGALTYKEMYEYLKRSVGVESVRLSLEQDPVVNYNPSLISKWEKWTFQ